MWVNLARFLHGGVLNDIWQPWVALVWDLEMICEKFIIRGNLEFVLKWHFGLTIVSNGQ